MEAIVRDFDWSRTPLGPQKAWPQSLRTVVSLCLASRFPMLVVWGREHIQIYNDAFRPILGARKHASALGGRAKATWAEIWTAIGPMFASVLEGKSQSGDDGFFLLERSGYPEETYFNFSYDPIRGDDGAIAGICVVCMETTGRVLGERRLRTLRDVAEIAAKATSEASACDLLAATLGANAAPMREPAYVDREMWEKIVLNLLSNALKFTFEGEIGVQVARRDDAFHLVVRDSGIGISEGLFRTLRGGRSLRESVD